MLIESEAEAATEHVMLRTLREDLSRAHPAGDYCHSIASQPLKKRTCYGPLEVLLPKPLVQELISSSPCLLVTTASLELLPR